MKFDVSKLSFTSQTSHTSENKYDRKNNDFGKFKFTQRLLSSYARFE